MTGEALDAAYLLVQKYGLRVVAGPDWGTWPDYPDHPDRRIQLVKVDWEFTP